MKKEIARLSLLMSFLLAFAILVSAEGRNVAVTAEKEVDIQNDNVAAARTLALSLAARDAVEKAFGVFVRVEEVKEARKVFASAASSLKYTILAEQQRGNKYWVKISANVNVPDEYAGASIDEREDMGEEMQNFVQRYPQGEINWGESFVLAHGKGQIPDDGAPNAEERAARAAEVDAKAHLLEIIKDIPLDDRGTAGQDKRVSFLLEGFVQGAAVVARTKSGKFVHVSVQAPIRGIKGLTMTILGHYTPEPPPAIAQSKPIQPAPIPEPEIKKFTGIVIDARKSAAAPAVFPKIQDSQKREVYSVKTVNKEDLQRRGMASYAVVSREAVISRLFPDAIIIRASYQPEDPKPSAAGSSRKRRQGFKPLVVSVQDAGGTIRTNLIVSDEDAKKIKAIDEKTSVLKEARVVVVVSSKVGGLEGKLLMPSF